MKFLWWLLFLPSVALASTENWPQLYNTGVTAYESNDFARAAQLFENATSSQDRLLQQRALYNLGNTDYRLGQSQPKQAQQLWQRAMKSYETALAIDPNDADAKYNHEFVKKKLEELKQQQQQQQQQNQKNQQDKNQDQKKDQQQQSQDQQNQQQQSQDKQSEQQQQSQDKQSQQQQQQQSQQEQDKQQSQQSQEQQKKDQQKADQQQQQKDQQQQGEQAKQDKQSQPEQQQQESGRPEGADKMQATELLDNLREDERNWNFFPEAQMKDLKDSGEPAKDW
jgi:Ca-activated chloride channel homolog